MSGLVITALFVLVALLSFMVGRATGQPAREQDLSRALHPTRARDTITPSTGEHVRLIVPPYDWDDAGTEQGELSDRDTDTGPPGRTPRPH